MKYTHFCGYKKPALWILTKFESQPEVQQGG